jgi:hypothetical protein
MKSRAGRPPIPQELQHRRELCAPTQSRNFPPKPRSKMLRLQDFDTDVLGREIAQVGSGALGFELRVHGRGECVFS